MFTSTPDGVVSAAMYELHRGDKRSLREILADTTSAKTERGADAAIEGTEHFKGKDGKRHTRGSNDDPANAKTIGTVTKKDKKGKEVSSAVGPITVYTHAADRSTGVPWCGSFATYVYARCGIDVGTLAFSLDVPNQLAKSEKGSVIGAYQHMTGDEEKGHGYHGELETGMHAARNKKHKLGGQRYEATDAPSTFAQIDIRAGDVFWQEHSPSTGHVGIVVGVTRTESEITAVTIEGNASDEVRAKEHKISVDAKGKIASGFKGWGRPAELNGAAPTLPAQEPAWIEAVGKRDAGSDNDR